MTAVSKKIKDYIKPMLATAVDTPFDDRNWLFEMKLDGYRAIAETGKRKLLLYSRNGLSLKEKYPTIVTALEKISHHVILDGEIVLLNKKHKPDFQKLQNYAENVQNPLIYYVFDILSFEGHNLEKIPLMERKKLLKTLLKKTGIVRYCDHSLQFGKEFFKKIRASDLEGMVAKKKDSLYHPGIRSREWLKIKYHKSQEAVICGFTAPKGSRIKFGSLLLGEYEKGRLQYIGHAGTGFTDETLVGLMNQMKPLITSHSPFDTLVKANNPVTWLIPRLVCEVAYTEITRDGILRHPVFKGLRPEKSSHTIKKKTEMPLPVSHIISKLNK